MNFANQILARLLVVGLACLQAQIGNGEDFVRCKVEKEVFRQFCEVDERSVTVDAKLAQVMTISGMRLEFGETLRGAELKLEDAAGVLRVLVLESLRPHLKVRIAWNGSDKCRVNRLWKEKIRICVRNSAGEDRQLSVISLGDHLYDLDLSATRTSDFCPWNFETESSDHLQLSVRFVLHNLDGSKKLPLPQERIPVECKMSLENPELVFSAVAASTDLQYLAQLAGEAQAVLTKSLLLHWHILDAQNGAICSVLHIANVLRSIEGLGPSEGWDTLSLASQQAIVNALNKAEQIGAMSCDNSPLSSRDPVSRWNFFTSIVSTERMLQLCSGTTAKTESISPETFMSKGKPTHAAGYSNARDFVRSRENLRQIVSAVLAIVSVGKLDVATNPTLNWVVAAPLRQHLGAKE